jgi:hypothetical protein
MHTVDTRVMTLDVTYYAACTYGKLTLQKHHGSLRLEMPQMDRVTF